MDRVDGRQYVACRRAVYDDEHESDGRWRAAAIHCRNGPFAGVMSGDVAAYRATRRDAKLVAGSHALFARHYVVSASVRWVSYQTAIKLAEHKRRLQAMSSRDGMTGVHNRRHWEILLRNEFDHSRRHHREATLLIIDIDHFKSINDTGA